MSRLRFLKSYNNYYNRIIKTGNYTSYIDQLLLNINFNPNDDLVTEQIVNWSNDWAPDYMLLENDEGNIVSRWFVLDWTRTRKNQYNVSLKKDVIADYYDKIVESPMFINKATIKDVSDPAVYNKEDIKVNQIKVGQYPIVEADQDNGRVCPLNWIVGYATKQADSADPWTEEEINTPAVVNEYASWDNFPLNSIVTTTDGTYKALNTTAKYLGFYVGTTGYQFDNGWVASIAYDGWTDNMPSCPKTYSWNVYARPEIYINANYFAHYVKSTTTLKCNTAPGPENPAGYASQGYRFDGVRTMLLRNIGAARSSIQDYINTQFVTNVTFDQAMYWDSKTIKVGNNYYLLNVQNEDVNQTDVATDLSQSVVDIISDGYRQCYPTGTWTGSPTSNNVFIGYKGKKFNIYARVVEQPRVTIAAANPNSETESFRTWNFSHVPYVDDAPYCIFAIPYTEEWYNTKMNIQGPFDNTASHAGTREVMRDRAFTLAQYIANQLQEGQFLIDMQILPYAPFDVHMITTNGLSISYLPQTHGHLFYYKDSNNNYNAYYPCFFAEKSDHKHLGGVWNGTTGTNGFADVGFDQTVEDKKIMNQCELFRFNSPSKSQFYDFNPAMNNGLSTIYIDFTYKPYQPFIYLRPKNYANSLYGNNNHDYVGLIATGDYSMPLLNDQWKTYQIQNKNFQKTFDRQVQHQEFENKWALAESITNMFTAPIKGAVSGGGTAAMASGGNPYATIAGAAVGAVVGQGGAIADLAKTIESQKENMSYMKDMFNYNIENIQALPDTLSSTTGFDVINKIYPFMEHYICFDKEKEAVRNKLTYSGMTIQRIDTISNFVYGDGTNYTEGILIRLEGVDCNPLEVNEINNELMKGVYL